MAAAAYCSDPCPMEREKILLDNITAHLSRSNVNVTQNSWPVLRYFISRGVSMLSKCYIRKRCCPGYILDIIFF